MIDKKYAEAVDKAMDVAVRAWVKEVGALNNHEWGCTMNGMAKASDEDVIKYIKREIDYYAYDYYHQQETFEACNNGLFEFDDCGDYEGWVLNGFANGIRNVMIGAM